MSADPDALTAAPADPPPAADGVRTGRRREAPAQRRTIAVLSAAQIMGSFGVGASFSVGALLAEELSGSEAWSGVAATATTFGAAAAAVPLARFAQRSGRRPALATGWLIAAAGALLAVVAAVAGLFPLYLLALMGMGAGQAANLQSRFAATDSASPEGRGRALGLVVWATTVGAVLGPNLTGPGAAVADVLSIPALSGPFVFSAVAAALAAATLFVALRPDPLLAARAAAVPAPRAEPVGTADGTGDGTPVAVTPPAEATSALAVIVSVPGVLVAVVSIVTAHAVMVAVMAMTPVHMHGHGATLTIIGLTISLHIAGMFALSPVVGWIADRRGYVATVLAGQAIMVTATVITATAGSSMRLVTAGLILLGLGWSFCTVAASTQLAEATPVVHRPRVQGTSDLLMSLAGGTAGALSGVLVALIGYRGLSLVALTVGIPAIVLVIRFARRNAAVPASAV